MQSPPASADITRVRTLSRRSPDDRGTEIEMALDQTLQIEVVGQVAGRRSPASATERSSSKAVSSRSRLCEDRIYQVLLLLARWAISTPSSSSEGHLIRRIRASQAEAIVDPG